MGLRKDCLATLLTGTARTKDILRDEALSKTFIAIISITWSMGNFSE